ALHSLAPGSAAIDTAGASNLRKAQHGPRLESRIGVLAKHAAPFVPGGGYWCGLADVDSSFHHLAEEPNFVAGAASGQQCVPHFIDAAVGTLAGLQVWFRQSTSKASGSHFASPAILALPISRSRSRRRKGCLRKSRPRCVEESLRAPMGPCWGALPWCHMKGYWCAPAWAPFPSSCGGTVVDAECKTASGDGEGFHSVFFMVVASIFPAARGGHLETCAVVHVFQAIDAFIIPSFVGRTCACCFVFIAGTDGSDSEALWCRGCDVLICSRYWPPKLEQRLAAAMDTM
ncbi:unnamed protein product, partial [Prorocentrum cordatum]